MESIKKEPIFQLQQLSAQKLVTLLDLCIVNKMPNPAEKVTRNLIHFAYANQFPEGIFFLFLQNIGNFSNSQIWQKNIQKYAIYKGQLNSE